MSLKLLNLDIKKSWLNPRVNKLTVDSWIYKTYPLNITDDNNLVLATSNFNIYSIPLGNNIILNYVIVEKSTQFTAMGDYSLLTYNFINQNNKPENPLFTINFNTSIYDVNNSIYNYILIGEFSTLGVLNLKTINSAEIGEGDEYTLNSFSFNYISLD